MKVGIVGYGYVGKAMYNFFVRRYDVFKYDIAGPLGSKADVNGCDVGVVAVPTPSTETGRCDVSAVVEVVRWLTTPLIIIKSTVEPGTTQRLIRETGKRIVFSPEYAGESSYWSPYDFHKEVVETPWFTFGGHPKDTSACVDLYLPIAGPTKRYIQTTPLEAELAKLVENSFYATKVALCYEFAHICEFLGADWNTVRELWTADPRLSPMHTAVFKENEAPFGGKCFPKDITALCKMIEDKGYGINLLHYIINANERLAKKPNE